MHNGREPAGPPKAGELLCPRPCARGPRSCDQVHLSAEEFDAEMLFASVLLGGSSVARGLVISAGRSAANDLDCQIAEAIQCLAA